MADRLKSEYIKKMEARKKLHTQIEVLSNNNLNGSLPLICLKSNKKLKKLTFEEQKLLRTEEASPQAVRQVEYKNLKKPKIKAAISQHR